MMLIKSIVVYSVVTLTAFVSAMAGMGLVWDQAFTKAVESMIPIDAELNELVYRGQIRDKTESAFMDVGLLDDGNYEELYKLACMKLAFGATSLDPSQVEDPERKRAMSDLMARANEKVKDLKSRGLCFD